MEQDKLIQFWNLNQVVQIIDYIENLLTTPFATKFYTAVLSNFFLFDNSATPH